MPEPREQQRQRREEQRPARRRDAEGRWQVAPTWETLIERQIREAAEAGVFDNLPFHGEPIPNDDNPLAGDWSLGFRVLKNAGIAPPWIEADKEVRTLLARRDAILSRASSGPPPTSMAQRRDRAALADLVAAVNAAIARVNADAPTDRQRRQALRVADELARYDDACRR